MGSRRTNQKGQQLQQLLDDGYLQCINNDLTTYARHNYEEKLDWILASQPTIFYINNVETHVSLGIKEDHKPLTFDLNVSADLKPMSPRLSFNFKKANWQLYRHNLNNLLSNIDTSQPMKTEQQIESYSSALTESIVSATQSSITKTSQTLGNFEPSKATKELIECKHRAYRKWKKTNIDINKKEYYNSKLLLTNALRNDRITRFKQLMSTLSSRKMHSSKVWATVKKFHNKRTKQINMGELKYKNISATSDNEKADLFASYFENEVFVEKPDQLPFQHQVTKQVDEIKKKLNTQKHKKKIPPITAKEIKTMLKQLPNSSPGADNVHNRCLKNYTPSLVNHLTIIFNAIITVGYIPHAWKNANIILVLKPKKEKEKPSSYRPISLLSCIGKLLEKIIKQRLTIVLDKRNILPVHQAGFRARKSTMYNVLRLERFAQEQLNQRRQSAVIFFDIKAAFDSVWFDGLIYKLYDLRLPEYLTRFIIAFLDHRTASIELENVLSRPFSLRSGTPQGSPLSPLLYIIYTNDSMHGIQKHTEHGLFADDTALWSSSNTVKNLKHRLQTSVDEFHHWCNVWKLEIQPIKTELIYFSPHPKKKYKQQVEINVGNTIIKPQVSARYLGVIFDQKLNWRSHIKHIESKLASRIGLLRFLSRSNPESNNQIMINIFKSLVRTVISYGSSTFITAGDKVWERLQIIQNKALRAALGIPPYTSVEYTHQLSNVPKIKIYATTLLHQSITRAKIYEDNISEEALIFKLAQL